MMIFSIIIPTWKRPTELTLILESIYKQLHSFSYDQRPVIEILICDSYSGIEIDSVVLNFSSNFPELNIRHLHTENIVAAKRNVGLDNAKGKYIIYLDDDCVPDEKFLNKCINYSSALDKGYVICGEIRFLDKQVITSNYYHYRDSRHPKVDTNITELLNGWSFVSMNYIASRKKLLDSGVRYKESFIGYGGEDHEYGFQLIENGLKIIQGSQAIWHLEKEGNITQYLKKIYHSSRDGMKELKKVNNGEYIKTHKKLYLIEKVFDSNNIFSNVLYITIFNKLFNTIVIKYIEYTDHNRKFYSETIFRYVILSSLVMGIKDRKKSYLKDLKEDWYQ